MREKEKERKKGEEEREREREREKERERKRKWGRRKRKKRKEEGERGTKFCGCVDDAGFTNHILSILGGMSWNLSRESTVISA